MEGEILRFSFIGMKTKEVTVGASNTIDVVLEEDADQLDEIVVTAFGVQKEAKKLGYVVQEVNQESSKGQVENKKEEIDLLEQNIISSVIDNSIQQEIEQYEFIEENQELEKTIEKEDKPLFDENTSMPFSQWISLNKEIKPKEKQSANIDQLLANLSEKNKKRTSKKAEKFFSPTEAAKLSLVDNEELVTETLAEIHIKQGNYPKAIKIYQQLMLKNPEKKAFFASRINYINLKTKL